MPMLTAHQYTVKSFIILIPVRPLCRDTRGLIEHKRSRKNDFLFSLNIEHFLIFDDDDPRKPEPEMAEEFLAWNTM